MAPQKVRAIRKLTQRASVELREQAEHSHTQYTSHTGLEMRVRVPTS